MACQTEPLCDVEEVCCSAREEVPIKAHQTVATQYSANVVVIGAGMAGLSAANHLRENGIENVTVLEALDRFVYPGTRFN